MNGSPEHDKVIAVLAWAGTIVLVLGTLVIICMCIVAVESP